MAEFIVTNSLLGQTSVRMLKLLGPSVHFLVIPAFSQEPLSQDSKTSQPWYVIKSFFSHHPLGMSDHPDLSWARILLAWDIQVYRNKFYQNFQEQQRQILPSQSEFFPLSMVPFRNFPYTEPSLFLGYKFPLTMQYSKSMHNLFPMEKSHCSYLNVNWIGHNQSIPLSDLVSINKGAF